VDENDAKTPIDDSDDDALHVVFVLDESGSMHHAAPAIVTGFNEFLDELRLGGASTLVSATWAI
jgi:hypothetical protein